MSKLFRSNKKSSLDEFLNAPKTLERMSKKEAEAFLEPILDHLGSKIPKLDKYGEPVFPNGRQQIMIIIRSLSRLCHLTFGPDSKNKDKLVLDNLRAYFYVYVFWKYNQSSQTLYQKIKNDCSTIYDLEIDKVVAYCLCNLKNNYFQYYLFNQPALDREIGLIKQDLKEPGSYNAGLKKMDFTSFLISDSIDSDLENDTRRTICLQGESIEEFLNHLTSHERKLLNWKHIKSHKEKILTFPFNFKSRVEEYHAFTDKGEKYTELFINPDSEFTVKTSLRKVRYPDGPIKYDFMGVESSLDLFAEALDFLNGADPYSLLIDEAKNTHLITKEILELHEAYENRTEEEKRADAEEIRKLLDVRVHYPEPSWEEIENDRIRKLHRKKHKREEDVLETLFNYGFDQGLLISSGTFNQTTYERTIKYGMAEYFSNEKLVALINHFSFEDGIRKYISLLIFAAYYGIVIALNSENKESSDLFTKALQEPFGYAKHHLLMYILLFSRKKSGGTDMFFLWRMFRDISYICVSMLSLCSYKEGKTLQMIECIIAMIKLGMYVELDDLYPKCADLKNGDPLVVIEEMKKLYLFNSCTLAHGQLPALLINLEDAERNLSADDFESLQAVYLELTNDHDLKEMDMDEFYSNGTKIVRRCEKIAPYFLYDGCISQDISDELKSEIQRLYQEGKRFNEMLIDSEKLQRRAEESEFIFGLCHFAELMGEDLEDIEEKSEIPNMSSDEPGDRPTDLESSPVASIDEEGPAEVVNEPAVQAIETVETESEYATSDTAPDKEKKNGEISIQEQLELLSQLKALLDDGALNQEEFEKKKKEILGF